MNKLNSIVVISVVLSTALFPVTVFSAKKVATQNDETDSVNQKVPSLQQQNSKKKSESTSGKDTAQTVMIQEKNDSEISHDSYTTEADRTTTEITSNVSNDISVGGSVESEDIENTDSSVDAIDSSIDTSTNVGDNIVDVTDSGDAGNGGEAAGESDDSAADSAETSDDSSSDSD